jgi:uncharacterized protein YecE (DUF72 family)
MSNLRIGTSGWNYPAGHGTWNGIFYPAAVRGRGGKRGAGPKFDELAYYAEHFDTVEVNTTFYGQPKAAVAQTWADRTPEGFEFSLKLYRGLTHADIPGVPRLDPDAIDVYRRGIDPLAAAGKVGALLAQFPPSFKQSPESQGYLDALLQRFRGYPIAVELRHRSWSDDFSSTVSLLNSHQAALTQIDEPKFKVSIRQNQLPNIPGFYYMRLHGRNTAQWWKHDKSEDRYNYLYSADELKPFAGTADAARRLVKKFYLYFNNHFASKAVVNAIMIKDQLGEPITGAYPKAFVERYPETASIVSTDMSPQFAAN